MILPAPQMILIIEDDSTMMHIAESRCTAYGYQTHGVSSGEEALQWLGDHHPDLILVDISLPGMDGLACLEQLRQFSHGSDSNILVVSSCEDSDVIDRAFTLGVDDFIRKPVNWQILIQRIQRILHSKQVLGEVNVLHHAITNGHDAVFVTDSDNRIRYVNPAFTLITGYSRDDAIGENPRLLASGKHDRAFYQSMWQQINEVGEWRGTITDRRKDGSLFEHRIHISAIHPNGNLALPISHYIAVSGDATREVAWEKQMREQEKMESIVTTVGGVAHDFNNMLAGITGNTFLMRQHIEHPDKISKYVDTIEVLSNHGTDLIKKMLAFVQRDLVQMEPVMLHDCIGEAIARQQREVEYHPCSLPVTISADRNHIAQMLDTLLDNACDAIRDQNDGKIIIRTHIIAADATLLPSLEQGVSYAKISVEDNGYGMSAETESRIFEPFFTTKAVDEGRGLGLSMLYGSMATHHGAVQVESNQNAGCCFTLYFPLLEERLEENEVLASKNDQASSQEPVRTPQLLLVDDETGIREVSEEILLDAGFKVASAASGNEALQRLSQINHAIDLALLDVVMPDINGIDLARQLRQQGHQFPIIFCTGYNRYEVLDQATSIANIDVISKPFSYDALIAMVKNTVNFQF